MDTPPPAYPDDQDVLPAYSFLEQLITAYGPVPTPTQPDNSEYVCATKRLSLNLGRRIHGTAAPSYGKNAVIQGSLTISDFKYVKSILVTIWGRCAMVVINRSNFPVFRGRRNLLFHEIPIWSSDDGTPRPTGPQTYPISFPLPTYMSGNSTPLPPSMIAAVNGVETEVRYLINVDMVKDTLHRNESMSAPFFYLPRSIPARLGGDMGCKTEVHEGMEWTVKEADRARDTISDGTIIRLGFPVPLSYTAGQLIPFKVSIVTPQTISEALIRAKLKIYLFRIYFATVDRQRVRVDRTAGVGTIRKVDRPTDSRIWEISGDVMAGRPKGEVSWEVPEFIEVRYAVLLMVGAMEGIPAHRCEETVKIVTDDASAFDMEYASERPALGLLRQSSALPHT